MSGMTRRQFLKRTIASGVAGGLVLSGLHGVGAEAAGTGPVGTIIDLTRCDGCQDRPIPACVSACREANKHRFPEPGGKMHDYWPQKKHEDWSQKRQLTNRLTPYNWTFVQHVEVEHQGRQQRIFVPRRCMHCDNPPCSRLCPFGVNEKTPEGPTRIDPEGCFGGAKCRDVCPWGIPQRQAGVGIYMKLAPKFVGGGVMYKCDLCYDRIKSGGTPACVEACPKQAITFGPKEQMKKEAQQRAKQYSGFIYGDKENGGTSTFYISAVPFQKIHKALALQDSKPGLPSGEDNYLDTINGISTGVLIAPIAGAFAAGLAAFKTMRGEKKTNDRPDNQ